VKTICLIGTLDTKGIEYEFVKKILINSGCQVILMDVGVLGSPQIHADLIREEVAKQSGMDLSAILNKNDRGFAIEQMSKGTAKLVLELYKKGQLDGVMALGGSGGSSIATFAMRVLPIGIPKLMVSTIASSDVSSYVGQSDITMMYSIVDIAGINGISERILTNAAHAIVGMVKNYRQEQKITQKKHIAITMFGVTTPCVTQARLFLENLGYEVIPFHANGSGGRAMETLLKDGYFDGVLDVTTTELADELVGGSLSAGPERLEMAGNLGIPQVVSLGALDIVNFGPIDQVPEKFKDRNLYKHNPNVTLMRTNKEECQELGRILASKLNKSNGPVSLFIPKKGISSIAQKNQVFYDPEADQALIDGLINTLEPDVDLVIKDMNINELDFAEAMASKIHQQIKERNELNATTN
jgi:uncharacterized protein (UPF0261 family)